MTAPAPGPADDAAEPAAEPDRWTADVEAGAISELAAAEPADDLEHQDDDDELDTRTDDYSPGYVAKLRRQSAGYREKATAAETRAGKLAAALWHARVEKLGVLADPTDLPYDPDKLDDVDAIAAVAAELVAAKPHLRSRRVTTPIGQGLGQPTNAAPSLSALLRAGLS